MKKSILTIGLFSLVMILTSFTTPETSTKSTVGDNAILNIDGSNSVGGNRKVDIDGSNSVGGNRKVDIDGSNSVGGNRKVD